MNPLRPYLTHTTAPKSGRIRAALVMIGEFLACAAIFGTAWLLMFIGYGMGLQ